MDIKTNKGVLLNLKNVGCWTLNNCSCDLHSTVINMGPLALVLFVSTHLMDHQTSLLRRDRLSRRRGGDESRFERASEREGGRRSGCAVINKLHSTEEIQTLQMSCGVKLPREYLLVKRDSGLA